MNKYNKLIKQLKKMAKTIDRLEMVVKFIAPRCSHCGLGMVVRQNSYTSKLFYGCALYPHCKDMTGLCMNLECHPAQHPHGYHGVSKPHAYVKIHKVLV